MEFTGNIKTAYTSAGVTAKTLVKSTGTNEDFRVETCTASDAPIGVAIDTAAAGGQVGVALDGIGRITLGEAVTTNAMLSANSSGQGILATSSSYYALRALENGNSGATIGYEWSYGYKA